MLPGEFRGLVDLLVSVVAWHEEALQNFQALFQLNFHELVDSLTYQTQLTIVSSMGRDFQAVGHLLAVNPWLMNVLLMGPGFQAVVHLLAVNPWLTIVWCMGQDFLGVWRLLGETVHSVGDWTPAV